MFLSIFDLSRNDIANAASESHIESHRLVERLERQLEAQDLKLQVLQDLVLEFCNLSESELLDRIRQLKIERAIAPPKTCMHCGKVLSRKLGHCIYCGEAQHAEAHLGEEEPEQRVFQRAAHSVRELPKTDGSTTSSPDQE